MAHRSRCDGSMVAAGVAHAKVVAYWPEKSGEFIYLLYLRKEKSEPLPKKIDSVAVTVQNSMMRIFESCSISGKPVP